MHLSLPLCRGMGEVLVSPLSTTTHLERPLQMLKCRDADQIISTHIQSCPLCHTVIEPSQCYREEASRYKPKTLLLVKP